MRLGKSLECLEAWFPHLQNGLIVISIFQSVVVRMGACVCQVFHKSLLYLFPGSVVTK